MCATHNREERKKKRDEEKEKHKRSKQQRLSEQRNAKYRERAREKERDSPKDSKGLPKPIKPRSTKRAGQEREYLKIRLKYLQQFPECEICGSPATQIHHKAGRIGELLTNVSLFLPCCYRCHEWIEMHPEKAKEFGYSVNRLNL